jgi:hypothetical protein
MWLLWAVMAFGVALLLNGAWAASGVLYLPSQARTLSGVLSWAALGAGLSCASVRVWEELFPAAAYSRCVLVGTLAGSLGLLVLAIVPYYYDDETARTAFVRGALLAIPLEAFLAAAAMGTRRLLASPTSGPAPAPRLESARPGAAPSLSDSPAAADRPGAEVAQASGTVPPPNAPEPPQGEVARSIVPPLSTAPQAEVAPPLSTAPQAEVVPPLSTPQAEVTESTAARPSQANMGSSSTVRASLDPATAADAQSTVTSSVAALAPSPGSRIDPGEALRAPRFYVALGLVVLLGLGARQPFLALVARVVVTGLVVGMYRGRTLAPPEIRDGLLHGFSGAAALGLVALFLPPVLGPAIGPAGFSLLLAALYVAAFVRLRAVGSGVWSGCALGGALVALMDCVGPVFSYLAGLLAVSFLPVRSSGLRSSGGRRTLRIAALSACFLVYGMFVLLMVVEVAPPNRLALSEREPRYGGMIRLGDGSWLIDGDAVLGFGVERATGNPHATGDLLRLAPALGTARADWPFPGDPRVHLSAAARSLVGDLALVFAASTDCALYVATEDGGVRSLGHFPYSSYLQLMGLEWSGDDLELLFTPEHRPYRLLDCEVWTVAVDGTVTKRVFPAPRPVPGVDCTVEAAVHERGRWKLLVSAVPYTRGPEVEMRLFEGVEGGEPYELTTVAVGQADWLRGAAVSRASGHVLDDFGFVCVWDPDAGTVAKVHPDGGFVTADYRLHADRLIPVLRRSHRSTFASPTRMGTGSATPSASWLIDGAWTTLVDGAGGLRVARGGREGPVVSVDATMREDGRLVSLPSGLWLIDSRGQVVRIDSTTLARLDSPGPITRVHRWFDEAPLPPLVLILLASPLVLARSRGLLEEDVVSAAALVACAEVAVCLCLGSVL